MEKGQKKNSTTTRNQPNKDLDMRPQNIAEYLFSNEKGDIADDIDSQEVD